MEEKEEINNEPIEKTQFTKDWLEDFEKTGFTWAQLKFLEKWYSPPRTLGDLF